MTFTTVLMILGAVAAFGYGLWAGFGRFDQSQEEIERAMTEDGHRREVTRHFTPLDLVARMTGVSSRRDRGNPFRFDEEESERLRDAGRSPRSSDGASPSGAQKSVDDHQDGSDDASE